MTIDKRTMKISTTTTNRLSIGKADLIELLNDRGFSIPSDADVTVQVPRGGDYSGCDLDIENDVEIEITYMESS